MTRMTSIFDAVVKMVADLNLYASPIVGAMPADNGIAMQISTGANDTTFLEKDIVVGFSVVLNGKHSSQKTVLDDLNKAHEALTMTKEYPTDDDWQICDIRSDSLPNYIGREDNQYLYGSALRVRAYITKGQITNGTSGSV